MNISDRPVAAPTPSDIKKSNNIGILKNLLPYLRSNAKTALCAVVAIAVASIAVLAFGQGLRGIVDHGLAGQDTDSLDRAFTAMIGIILVLAAASAVRMYAVSAVGERITAQLRQDLYSHLLTLPPAFFESARIGEILSRLTNDTGQIQSVITTSFPIALRNSALLLGAASMLFFTSAKLTGIVSLVVPVVIVPLIWIGRKVRKLSRATQDRVADLSAYGGETLQSIRVIQSYTHETEDRLQFSAHTGAALSSALARAGLRAVLSAMIIGLIFSSIAIVLWIGGYDVLDGTITGGQLASFVFYAIVLAGSVAALSEVASDLQRASGSLERIIELLQTTPEIQSPATPKTIAENADPSKPLIEFRGVDFHYPSRPDHPSLSQLNLKIYPGESIGIVGGSGAGKTTIFQLALRFYDPTGGQILFQDTDLRDLDLRDLRGRFSYVGQDPVIFSTTLRDNIRYGRINATDQEIAAVCRLARVDEFLKNLPDGMDTYLGERGTRLSGGQKQRIAIARAILRNPDILLLDEATSQLDSENEMLVQSALQKLAQGRTTITIAHRLSTLRHCDRILVLNSGHIAGLGHHEELLQNNPVYRNLVELQIAA